MKIVFATSEMVPYAKTGGLADVCGSLPAELAGLGHSLKIFMPRYKQVDMSKFGLKLRLKDLEVPIGTETKIANIYAATFKDKVEVYFVDDTDFFTRDQLYGTPQGDYPDNDRRFIFFQRAVIESLKKMNFKPDVINCHDWQSGLIPVYLKTVYKDDPFFKKTKTIFTVHNLAYQGNFPPDTLPLTGISWEEFTMHRLEFYGKVSFLKGGLVYSDMISTVSQRYAEEIQTKEYGCGMEGVLAERKKDLFGIVNGIDLDYWNPATDPDISVNYSVSDFEKKLSNKGVLQKENGLDVDPQIPTFGMISRLADQKGLDILAPAMEKMAKMKIQFVVLGTGEERYHKILQKLEKKYPKKFSMNILFDPKMAKRIYSGCDIFMMPSYFEPCGLGQFISMRYGTVPLVRETGGLADTVSEFNPKTGKGNGFVFSEYNTSALLTAVKRAVSLYKNKEKWHSLMKNGMRGDYSWTASAKKYIEFYKRAEKKPIDSNGSKTVSR
jgi:starch synthase